MNYNEILKKGENYLRKNKIKNPNLDAELILSKVLNKKREEILLNTNNKLKNRDILIFEKYLQRRFLKEPMAYILGYKYFWKYKFLANKSVLIPRPDTELIIEESLNYIRNDKSKQQTCHARPENEATGDGGSDDGKGVDGKDVLLM